MKGCGFEPDLARALRDGNWPAACDPALRQHVAGCAACSDLLLITTSLQSARAGTLPLPVLPPPGIVWWRAQLRRRNAATERMTRPVVFVEVIALAATLLALVFVARVFVDWSAFADNLAPSGYQLADVLSSFSASIPGWLALGALVLFAAAGFAVYALAHNE